MRYCKLKIRSNRASVKCTAFQNCISMKKTPWQTKPHQKLLEHKMCLTICICDQTTPWQGVYFFTNTVKAGTVLLMLCFIKILVVVIFLHYVFHENTALNFKIQKRTMKIEAPKFWPSNHYISIVQTSSNLKLQKLLKSEL